MAKLSAKQLIRVDWIGGIGAGVLVLLFRNWLSGLYVLPVDLLAGIGVANLAYGCVSFTLASRSHGETVPGLRAMASANVAWAVFCLAMATVWMSEASVFGVAQFFGEALFVGTLGLLEWRAAGQS